jgi:hypothetical protein
MDPLHGRLVQCFHILHADMKIPFFQVDQPSGNGLEDKRVIGATGIGQAVTGIFLHCPFL